MKFVFEVKDENKMLTKQDYEILRKIMFCHENTINTALPKIRVHLTEQK